MSNMESSIKELFGHQNRTFEIPAYQRAYSWGETQIKQFIEDLDNCVDSYYLGHFLFEAENIGKEKLFVIDGQQRLTTCVILLSVIKHILDERKNAGETTNVDVGDIEHYYLRDTRKGTQKFCTVHYDNNFFLNEIIDFQKSHQEAANTLSRTNIREAKKLFLIALKKKTVQEIEKWVNLLQEASITVYTVPDKVRAAEIFAYQNDRGKKLTNLEVIKAYLMLNILLCGQDSEKTAQDIAFLEREFAQIYQQMMRIDLDEDTVLNFYWRSRSEKGFNSENVITEVKEQVKVETKAKRNVPDWAKRFVSGLSLAFQTVEKLEKSEGIETRNLNYLNNQALSYPFLIKAYAMEAEGQEIQRLVNLLENITFRALIRGGRAAIESRLNWLLVQLSDNGIPGTIDWIKNAINSDGGWGYWSDGELTNHLQSGWFYGNRVDNYLLWRYELHLSGKGYPLSPKLAYKNFISQESIEHIAPQTPTDGKPVENGYGVYDDKNKPGNGIESGEWLNCLGNLMLISKSHNSSIGNKPFAHKLASYGKDNLLNQQKEIADFVANEKKPVWDVAAISKRRDKIVTAAMEMWDIKKI